MGIFGLLGNIASSAMQYATNRELQQKQFDFQERMSNTAHQREVKDLRNAGLNPILSATGGSGASTPSGGTSSVDNPNLTEGWLKSEQSKATASQVKLNESEINLNNEQAETEESKREYNEALSGLTNMEKLIKSEEFKYLPEKLQSEIKMNYAKASESYSNASARQVEASSSKITAEANKTKAETNKKDIENKYNGNKTKFKLGPIEFEKYNDKSNYRENYEIINGKKVKVREYY